MNITFTDKILSKLIHLVRRVILVANRLKTLRAASRLKQKDLAKILSVSQSSISGWESGRYEIDKSNLCKIADYFNVSIDYLLYHTNDQYSDENNALDLNVVLDKDVVLFKKKQLSTDDKTLLKQILQHICQNPIGN